MKLLKQSILFDIFDNVLAWALIIFMIAHYFVAGPSGISIAVLLGTLAVGYLFGKAIQRDKERYIFEGYARELKRESDIMLAHQEKTSDAIEKDLMKELQESNEDLREANEQLTKRNLPPIVR